MGSEFEGGFTVLPPIGENGLEEVAKDTKNRLVNGLKVNGNRMDIQSNCTDKHNNANHVTTHSKEENENPTKLKHGKIKSYHNRNKVTGNHVNGDIQKTVQELPPVPFHSILDKRPFSRRSTDSDDRYSITLLIQRQPTLQRTTNSTEINKWS